MRTLKIAAVMVLLVTSIAAADPIDQYTYVESDAFVKGGWAGYTGVNYGALTYVNLNASTYSCEAYLRFDITGLIPAGHEVISAGVRLYWPSSTTLNVGLFGLADGATGDAAPGSGGWIESGTGGITWDNAPTASTSLGTYAKTAYGSQYMEASSIVDFLNADTNGLVTFKLTSDSASLANFSAKEGGVNSSAYVYFTTVPEPATMSLLGVGAILGLLRIRRRK